MRGGRAVPGKEDGDERIPAIWKVQPVARIRKGACKATWGSRNMQDLLQQTPCAGAIASAPQRRHGHREKSFSSHMGCAVRSDGKEINPLLGLGEIVPPAMRYRRKLRGPNRFKARRRRISPRLLQVGAAAAGCERRPLRKYLPEVAKVFFKGRELLLGRYASREAAAAVEKDFVLKDLTGRSPRWRPPLPPAAARDTSFSPRRHPAKPPTNALGKNIKVARKAIFMSPRGRLLVPVPGASGTEGWR